MRFLVESGTYRIDNVGDIAMLQRTVWRLAERFPGARVGVVTERPERLRRVLPEVEPVPAAPWFRLKVLPVPGRWEYTPAVQRLRQRERLLAGCLPRLVRTAKRHNRWSKPSERDAADRFYETVRAADAVVAAGGGYINDHFHEHAWKVFATLNLAQGLGKPTAMFSIGLGPVSRDELVRDGGAVLRRLSLLALRESDLGPAVARQLGVPDDRILITGDDAIALAARHPVPSVEHRCKIGVNVRLADFADVPAAALPRVRGAVTNAAQRHGADLLPLIVRTADSPANDLDAIAHVFGSDALDLARARAICAPQQALTEIAQCRVVVTGAYHNAVFALSMGIPVVALSRSAYYDAKLNGVARQFGAGMTVLSFDDPNLQEKLTAEVGRFWHDAPALEAPLKSAAAAQVARGEAAYDRFCSMLVQPRGRISA